MSNTPKYVLLWEALGYGAAARLRPPAAAPQRRRARSCPSAGTRWPSRTTATRATCPRPCATTWPCSAGRPGDDREILTLDEMIAEFRLEDVKSRPAIFDERKLQSVNAEYLRALRPGALRRSGRRLVEARWEPIAPLVQERARTLAEVFAMTDFLFLPQPAIDVDEWEKASAASPPSPPSSTPRPRPSPPATGTPRASRRPSAAAGESAGVTQLRQSPGTDPPGRDRAVRRASAPASRSSCWVATARSPASRRGGAGWTNQAPRAAPRGAEWAFWPPSPPARQRGRRGCALR